MVLRTPGKRNPEFEMLSFIGHGLVDNIGMRGAANLGRQQGDPHAGSDQTYHARHLSSFKGGLGAKARFVAGHQELRVKTWNLVGRELHECFPGKVAQADRPRAGETMVPWQA
uniref:hypothetical protein n=1 Tax=Neorhizobium sp. SOG26 TaxID=2060726 RepID=UPI001FE22AAD|nr:hypothetical protein [Neorhizobium sp. SOG26]